MIIAVPTFAVIYRTLSLYVKSALKKRNYSENTPDYCRLHHIDPRTGDFVDMNQWLAEGKEAVDVPDETAESEAPKESENTEKE